MSIQFGISFSGTAETLRSISGILKNGRLKALDIGGDCLAQATRSPHHPIPILSVDDLISPMDARNLINQKDALRRQFLFELEKRMGKLAPGLAKFATVDFKIEECIGDMFYYEDAVRLMKNMAAILKRREMTLCVPAREPSAVREADAGFYRRFLTDVMLPNCLLALEIHPHEMKKKEELESAAKSHRFDTAIVRIKYDASSGNGISHKLFTDISAALAGIPSAPPCFFDPMKHDFATMRREITSLSGFLP